MTARLLLSGLAAAGLIAAAVPALAQSASATPGPGPATSHVQSAQRLQGLNDLNQQRLDSLSRQQDLANRRNTADRLELEARVGRAETNAIVDARRTPGVVVQAVDPAAQRAAAEAQVRASAALDSRVSGLLADSNKRVLAVKPVVTPR